MIWVLITITKNVTNIKVGNLIELVDEFGSIIYIGEIYAREN